MIEKRRRDDLLEENYRLDEDIRSLQEQHRIDHAEKLRQTQEQIDELD